jgi:hypothetical protein
MHQINLCKCGKIVHWPARSKVGDTWRCRRCGTTRQLVAQGSPGADDTGVMASSKPPRPPKPQAPRVPPPGPIGRTAPKRQSSANSGNANTHSEDSPIFALLCGAALGLLLVLFVL